MEDSSYEVLVADAHSLCREGLANVVRTTMRVDATHLALDFATALAALTSHPAIRLASFDLELPGLRHGEGLRELRMKFPHLRVIAAIETANRGLVLETLASGVHGCFPKDLPFSEIVEAFRMVAAGQIFVPAMMSELDREGAHMAANDSGAHGGQLTDRQIEVLRLMAAGRSNKEIARQLCIAEGTVKVHIAAAFKFLKVHNRVSAVAAMRALTQQQEPEIAYLPGLFDEAGMTRYGRRRSDQVSYLMPVA